MALVSIKEELPRARRHWRSVRQLRKPTTRLHGADDVERFVAEKGVDFLAIAFGNAHGLYKGTPCLDLELVAEIRRRVEVPLVMHGETGVSDDQFRAAVQQGISKINFATSIMNSAADNMRATAGKPESTMFDIEDGIREGYRHCCSYLFDVFGTAGRAWSGYAAGGQRCRRNESLSALCSFSSESSE